MLSSRPIVEKWETVNIADYVIDPLTLARIAGGLVVPRPEEIGKKLYDIRND